MALSRDRHLLDSLCPPPALGGHVVVSLKAVEREDTGDENAGAIMSADGRVMLLRPLVLLADTHTGAQEEGHCPKDS